MSMDVGRALFDITTEAQQAIRAVDVRRVRARLRRRRTQGVVVRTAGGLGVVGAVVLAVAVLGGTHGTEPPALPAVTATPSTSPSATTSPGPTTALPGWVPGPAPCGADPAMQPVDSPDIEVQGGVIIGTLDPTTAAFTYDPAGSVVYLRVQGTSEVPGLPAGAGTVDFTIVLVGQDGNVAFWNDPARQLPQLEATDGSRTTSIYGLYDAVDCRTGRPLVGTYRAWAHEANGDETVELAPVTFGPGGTRAPERFADRLPACGQPAPASLLAGSTAADFTVEIDPKVSLKGVRADGLHAAVTVTASGPERLNGRVPQSLRAVLVDAQGIVVSEAERLFDIRADSGATFDVGPGESFPAEVFQWFTSCTDPATGAGAGNVNPGTYDLFVVDVLAATDDSGQTSPRTVVGGPFPITLQ